MVLLTAFTAYKTGKTQSKAVYMETGVSREKTGLGMPNLEKVESNRQMENDRFMNYAREVFEIESSAVANLSNLLDEQFCGVIRAILGCRGRVIVSGIGKSGIIGKKISCTLASTGTPSFFMHPAEAFHGDLGMITADDILLLISYSGETEELLKLIPFFKDNKNIIVTMTGNGESTLAVASNYHLGVTVDKEACPLQMAPTTSAAAALVMGDAIAVTLMRQRNFRVEDYAKFHPGGNLGRKMLVEAKDAMLKTNLPAVKADTSMKDAVQAMTSTRTGVAVVTSQDNKVLGIITDGDLRRAINQYENVFKLSSSEVMTVNPVTIPPDMKLYEAEKIYPQKKITCLIVADNENRFLGLLQYHHI